MNAIKLSVFTAERPDRLSKGFRLAQDGTLEKLKGGQLWLGTVETLSFDNITDVAELYQKLRPNNAAGYGVCGHEKARVATKKDIDRYKSDPMPTVARGRDHFAYPTGPGLLMLDYDVTPGAARLSEAEFRAYMYGVVPGLEQSPHLTRPSASSFIFNGDVELRGAGGLRMLVHVQDASDIPRAGETLVKRLWLAGHGRIEVGAAGQLLRRTLVDASVFQPERLDFAGGAAVAAPLEQRMPAPKVFNPDGPPLDTKNAIPSLSEAEEAAYAALVKAARQAARPEAELAKGEWIHEQVEIRLTGEKLEEKEADVRREALTEIYRQACDRRQLFGEFELITDDGKRVSVAEILDNPNKWHGKYFRDPLEPNYDGARAVAWLNLRAAGKPYLWSHAHGGQKYGLHRARKEIQLIAGERVGIVQKCLELMRLAGGVFDRGGELVRVSSDGVVRPLDLEGVLMFLDELAAWRKFDKKQGVWLACDCPPAIAKGILSRRGDWHLPKLQGVATAPVMDLSSGRIIDRDGYDEKTGFLLSLNDFSKWRGVPEQPTRAQVAAALDELWRPFELFPLKTALD